MTAPTTRTDGIDFAAILAARLAEWFDLADTAAANMAWTAVSTKVPELCPDCKGLASPDAAPGMVLGSCAHPNATTIGQMLREWQALTALVEYATHHDWNCPRPGRADCACGLDAARAALEAVRGD